LTPSSAGVRIVVRRHRRHEREARSVTHTTPFSARWRERDLEQLQAQRLVGTEEITACDPKSEAGDLACRTGHGANRVAS
jgi:hypothetical protein